MNRLCSVVVVGLLSLSTGGALELVFPEPCSETESASTPSDGTCAPTCVRCHCGRAFDLVVLVRAADIASRSPEWIPALSALPLPIPHDILHVPRFAFL